MSTEFTQTHQDSVWDSDLEYYSDALHYLNNLKNFRPFSVGLTELIKRYSYSGSLEDVTEKTNYLYNKLNAIKVSITKITIQDWFLDKRRPSFSSTSRTIMYQICFSLSATFDDVQWFFHHVYFDRSFNCHTIEESVYYYCFKNQLSYAHAKQLIHTIEAFPKSTTKLDTGPIFTRDIIERLNYYSSDEELLHFFCENNNLFNHWNQSASFALTRLLSVIQGKRSDKALLEQAKNGKTFSAQDMKNCGIIIQELLLKNSALSLKDFSGKNITSIDFMLDCIFNTTARINKHTEIPAIIKSNFPNKKVFSNLLKDIDTSTSYDSIRKCLILLNFYEFWWKVDFLNRRKNYTLEELFDFYIDYINNLLTSCGYEELFSGNPYDWLFLWASTTEQPLQSFRDTIEDVTFLDDED